MQKHTVGSKHPVRQYFKTVVAGISDKIPEGALENIWYEKSHIPNRPQLCEDMEVIFDKENMDDEFGASYGEGEEEHI